MNALFIPLKTEHFRAFQDGTKQEEFRPYGARWNETTCPPGRKATLSKGYGKYERLNGTITGFRRCGPEAHPAIRTIYPDGNDFCAIAIAIEAPPT